MDIAKLRDYCLNERHPRVRDKARVFATSFGITISEADVMQRALLNAAVSGDAVVGEADDYGQRYVLDFQITGPAGQAIVRSIWIIRHGEDFPRLTSCYVLRAI